MTAPLPAQAVEAERALLALMLNDPRNIPAARYVVSAADFYQPRHAIVFLAACDLHEANITADIATLVGKLNTPIREGSKKTHLDLAGGTAYLVDLFQFPCVGVNLEHYGRQMRDARRIRELVGVGQRLTQLGDGIDPDQVLDRAAAESIQLQLLVEDTGNDQVRGRYTIDDFLSIADCDEDWVIPDLLDRQDALMWLGDEGLGKSWLLRQFAMCLMCGVHPFRPRQRIPAKRALLIDVENSENTIRRALRPLSHKVARLGTWNGANMELLARPGGLNLRKTGDALEIERILNEFRPDMVVAGPMYKLAPRGHDDWDTAAAESREVLDRWREKYGVAYVLEHHMPKGDGINRPQTPFGGSEWMRWVTHGRIINEIPDSGLHELGNFRGDREPRSGLPIGLVKGGDLPWSPIWDPAELNHAKGLDPDGKRTKKGP